ncbi:thioredoxin family protein [Microvirga sp. VF16]|uniref:DUF1223 domain-containing protein n=1 Tax=Microvirga sp. VF16 TaxID=2807101 RepID=UPI00193D0A1D|nr:DUF1223 domain-containing protein [Microvirga sp. VF16]QRM34709.1 DUF1223 domain-containing protein [Microvirga sp. VF16]
MRQHLKSWLGLLPVASILGIGQVKASPEPREVLELFTSQGCSACWPANQLLSELSQDPGLIVLSLPVNYWDYLGWKDTLADPAFTARQRGYALARHGRQVYTPELIINGVLSRVGSAREQVTKALDRETTGLIPLPVAIQVTEENGLIVVEVGQDAGEARAWLLPVRRHVQVAIHRGENAGRMETYTNVVRGLYPLGAWSGSSVRFWMPLNTVQTHDADSYVVLLQAAQDGKPGRILGATKGPGL